MSPQGPIEAESSWRGPVRALVTGLLLTIAQIVLACLVGTYKDGSVNARPSNLAKVYGRLVNYDSQWYLWIADDGYDDAKEFQKGKRGNVAFFPGYPLAVRGVAEATGLPTALCLLIVAQLACWGVWTYFLLLLEHHDVPLGLSRLLAVLIASQPASFFLVAGYSESLFLFSLLGFIYWSDATHPALKWLGVLHGIVMTATRIVGLPLVIYPILKALLTGPRETRTERVIDGVLLAAVSSLGGLAFFGYCQYAFGAWDLYLTSQSAGWHVRPDYLALFNPETYLLDVELWKSDGFLNPDWLSRAHVPVFLLIFAIVLGIEIYVASTLPNSSFGERFSYFVLAFILYFVATAGLANNQYRSMIRYIIVCQVLLVIEIGHMLANEDIEGNDWGNALLAGVIIVPSFVIQGVYVHRFMNGMWVA